MSQQPAWLTPAVWLARDDGLAHAFRPSRVADGVTVTGSYCRTVRRDVGAPWTLAGFNRVRCRDCMQRVDEAERAADARAGKGGT